LTKLIPRFYDLPDPYEVQQDWGSVEIDGYDIRKYPRSVIRRNIAVVFQDSILFEGSIRDNIKLGRPNASDKDIFQAAERACIHDTILRDLGGYDAKIINHGKNLSGGQRQRLAIARAILRDAPILILDEPTAALDVEAEAEVMRALDGLVEGRTVLMITHRLSTIGRVDEIVVFEYGRIAEQGTYQELKKKGGVFTRLLGAQNAYHFDPEESKSFIHSQFVSLSPLYPKAHVLIEVDGKTIGKRLLDKEVLTVGRIAENDVQVPSRLVSRLHAKILWKEGTWVIKDADSTNKLQYKGQIVDQMRFTHGDHIYLSPNVLLKYEEQGQAPAQELQPKLQVPIPLPPSQLPLPQEQLPALLFPKAQLLLEIDGKVVDTRLLDRVTLNIGRLRSNEIPVPSSLSTQLISRSHATILWENGTWTIKERDNTNGLFYNGSRVKQHIFANGDRIFLAQTTVALRYELLP
jgi:ABC-type multidrug transport system ATPase subunit